MRPTLGRIVHVRYDAGPTAIWYAAIVCVAVDGDDTFMAFVFPSTSIPFQMRVNHADENKTWRWPPREGA